MLTDVLLPVNLRPYHYNLMMCPKIYAADGESEVDPESFHNIGDVEIYVECVKDTDVITMHVNKLRIDIGSIEVTHLEADHHHDVEMESHR